MFRELITSKTGELGRVEVVPDNDTPLMLASESQTNLRGRLDSLGLRDNGLGIPHHGRMRGGKLLPRNEPWQELLISLDPN